MCIPQTIAALQVLSAASQTVSAARDGRYAQKAAQQNAALAAQSAAEERRQGRLDANRTRLDAAVATSRKRNALAGAGVDLSSGSALDILEDSAEEGEAAARDTLRQSEARAYQQDVNANSFKSRAAQEKYRTYERLGQDVLSGGTTILTRSPRYRGRGILTY